MKIVARLATPSTLAITRLSRSLRLIVNVLDVNEVEVPPEGEHARLPERMLVRVPAVFLTT